ncbi:MAG: MBL fold metallo-hydrolase RNA specificity domain-containing protein [archaeon]
MVKITFKGASQEVGRSAFLVDDGDKILLDYGVKLTPHGLEYPLPIDTNLNAAIISHAHLDHTGNLPHLFRETDCLVYMTPPTLGIAKILWFDTLKIAGLEGMDANFTRDEIGNTEKFTFPIRYGKHMDITDRTSMVFHDAGHIVGSALTELRMRKKTLVYTGDFRYTETRLHGPAQFEKIKECDYLITESTYGCLVGDSKISMLGGTEVPIRDVAEGFMVKSLGRESNLGDFLVTRKWRHTYEGNLYTFITESNKKVTVTRNHPMFVKGKGAIKIKSAFEVLEGDLVPVVNKTTDSVENVSFLHLHELKCSNSVFVRLDKIFLALLREKIGKSHTSLSRILGIPEPTLKDYFKSGQRKNKFYFMPLEIAKRLSVMAGVSFDALEANVTHLKGKNSKIVFANVFPLKKDYLLAKLLAKSFGDGHVKVRQMYFDYRNISKELLGEAVKYACLLGFNPVKGSSDRLYFPFLGVILHTLGCPQRKVTEKMYVPSWIKNGSSDVKVSFLQGLFDDEGHVSNYVSGGRKLRRVMLKMAKAHALKENLVSFFADLKQMLLDLGINSRVDFGKEYGDKEMLLLVIQGKVNIEKFAGKIGFVHAKKSAALSGVLKTSWNFEPHRNENFEKILIVKKEFTSGTEVFDLTIGELGNWGNFVANGIILHNSSDHPDRKETEKKFVESVQETIDRGGHALLPSFAVGRSQEIIDVLNEYHIEAPIYYDGMGQRVARIYLENPSYLKNPKFLAKALQKVNWVKNVKMRKHALKEPSIIVCTSGMMQGGSVYAYLPEIYNDASSKIMLTGYQVDETPGRILLETGKLNLEGINVTVKAGVERYDFSAHAGKDELFKAIKKLNPEKVICVHGDKEVTRKFAKSIKQDAGIEAIVPELGKEIEL